MADKKDNGLKRWAILSGIGIQMGVIIYLFVKLGQWLDGKYTDGGKAFLIVCTLIGVAVSLFLVVKQTNKLNS
jgi:F0F1-type ATP synthase assembly protein I